MGLARHGIALLGVIPYRPLLSSPSLAMILEGTRAELLNACPDLDAVIGGISVAAMEFHHVLQHVVGHRMPAATGRPSAHRHVQQADEYRSDLPAESGSVSTDHPVKPGFDRRTERACPRFHRWT